VGLGRAGGRDEKKRGEMKKERKKKVERKKKELYIPGQTGRQVIFSSSAMAVNVL
jgi:hypothetical protein